MPDLRRDAERLVAADRLEQAAEMLGRAAGGEPSLVRELVALRSTLTRTAKEHRRGLVDDATHDRARRKAAHQLLEVAAELTGEGDPHTPAPSPPSVFLSYHHGDVEDARALEEALEAEGAVVRIDRDAMEPGEAIEAFIARSIRETRATVCLVSSRSLMSAWVAQETVRAFWAEGREEERRFIACYLDDAFFRPGFRLECTERIDGKIAEIEALLPEYAERRLDTDDLDAEKSRLYQLRNNLGSILSRLKDSLTLDAREGKRRETARRIVATLAEG